MQSLITSSRSGSAASRNNSRHFGLISDNSGIMVAPVNQHTSQDSDIAGEIDNQDGSIIIKKDGDVFYVRYDIIFAKAGDMFYMPRRVPQNFSQDTDRVIPFRASAGEFQKFYTENFLPVRKDDIKQFANLSESLQ